MNFTVLVGREPLPAVIICLTSCCRSCKLVTDEMEGNSIKQCCSSIQRKYISVGSISNSVLRWILLGSEVVTFWALEELGPFRWELVSVALEVFLTWQIVLPLQNFSISLNGIADFNKQTSRPKSTNPPPIHHPHRVKVQRRLAQNEPPVNGPVSREGSVYSGWIGSY